MATGITIDEVANTLDDIQGTEKIPVSSGISEPEVVTTGDLKNYINNGMQEEISDLSTIRSGASAGATAYQKPSSGIPSTDLASAVQTSLGKADTALQSFTETDPVFSASAAHSITSANIAAWNGKSDFSGSYNDLTDKPTIPTVPTTLSSFTDDLGSSPTHTHSQYLTQHQDISGKADKSEMSVSTSSDQTTITLKSGTSATVINQHQSLSGYVQISNTAGLIKNDGTIDTTSYGTYSKPAGGIPASDIASGVIPTVPSNIVTGSSQSYTIWSGTQAQYDALATKDSSTIYLIKEI